MRPLPLLLAFVVLAACRPPRRGIEDMPPEVTLTGVRIEHFQGHQLTAAGRAARLTYERDSSNFVAFEGLMRFPARGGAGPRVPGAADPSRGMGGIELRAPEVRGNLAAKQADGLSGVVMRSSSGMVGQAPRAHFDGVAMTAAGRESVRLSGPGYRLAARDFLFHFAQDTFEFGGVQTWLGDTR